MIMTTYTIAVTGHQISAHSVNVTWIKYDKALSRYSSYIAIIDIQTIYRNHDQAQVFAKKFKIKDL